LRIGFEIAAHEGVFEVTASLNGAQAKQEFRGELNLAEEKKQPVKFDYKGDRKHKDRVD